MTAQANHTTSRRIDWPGQSLARRLRSFTAQATHAASRFPEVCRESAPQRLSFALLCAAAIVSQCLPFVCRADDDLESLTQAAFAAAVDRVAPSVVRIETLGGKERLGPMPVAPGATTGLIVDPDGYIISSAFNFISQPSSILVRLPDGSRKPATLVATDHSRELVLLKIEPSKPLPVCEIVPQKDMRVGQWAIAVGRAFDSDSPNAAVGILSATNRIWGKAIQTDAPVSPNNYGGPLIDIQGRLLGILAPLSPDAAGEHAGVEWYDSGIGFAVPAETIQAVLPRLKKGENLSPGLAGITIGGQNLFTGEPVITACRPKSPAAVAGIKPGDRIVEIDGHKIRRAADVKEEFGRRYAGQKMHIVLSRDQAPVQADIQLAEKLEPFQHGFLGILPMRDSTEGGVAVRYVYPDSPAAKAGIARGDILTSLAGEPVGNRIELADVAGAHEPGTEIEFEFRRGEAVQKAKITVASIPESLPPGELPAAHGKAATASGNAQAAVGAMPFKIPEYPNDAWAYVPKSSQTGQPQGLIVWLHGPGGFEWQDLLSRWQPICDRYDIILIAPKANDPAKWAAGELAFVARLISAVTDKYPIDPARVMVAGQESGGTLALLIAARGRDVIRAVAAVDASPTVPMPENEPHCRLAVYFAQASRSRSAKAIDAAVATLRKMHIPTTVKSLGEMPRALAPDELTELARWFDMLDRI